MEPALIVYSTTTLSTSLLAHSLHRELSLAHVPAHPPLRVSSLPASALPLLSPHQPVVFLLSTTGAGEPNADLRPLWQLLMREGLPDDLLETVWFAVLGCGDSGYERFNWVGKIWRRRMLALGGLELAARQGEGEEGWWADERSSGGLEETFQPFTSSLVSSLSALYYPSPATPPPPLPSTTLLPSLYTAAPPPPSTTLSPALSTLGLGVPSTGPTSYCARLQSFDRLTASEWTQDVRLITLALPEGERGAWQPGWIAQITPENSEAAVRRFFELQPHLVPDETVQFARRKEVWELARPPHAGQQTVNGGADDDEEDEDFYTHHPPPLPAFAARPLTAAELVRAHLDLSAVPTRAFFQWLRLLTADEREIERLDEFLHPVEGPDDIYTYATQPRRSVLETLSDFRAVRIPLERLPEVLPAVRPREFSIANDAGQGKVELAVAMVGYRTKGLKAGRVGLCSAYFQSLSLGAEVKLDLVEGTMALPSVPNRPIVCVGPGTGIAPLRALIQRRVREGHAQNTVYFGCRSQASDFLFRDEWKRWEAEGVVELRTAFSRDQEEKRYVQHLIEEDAPGIYRKLVTERGYFYVSGSSNAMPRAVKKAVVRSFMREHTADGSPTKGVSEEVAQSLVERMEEEGRWSEECWS